MAKSSTRSPIDDLTYDVIAVLHSKAQALKAYEQFIGDARAEEDDDLVELFIQMRNDDEENVLELKEVLARRLDADLGYDDEDEDDAGDGEDEPSEEGEAADREAAR